MQLFKPLRILFLILHKKIRKASVTLAVLFDFLVRFILINRNYSTRNQIHAICHCFFFKILEKFLETTQCSLRNWLFFFICSCVYVWFDHDHYFVWKTNFKTLVCTTRGSFKIFLYGFWQISECTYIFMVLFVEVSTLIVSELLVIAFRQFLERNS